MSRADIAHQIIRESISRPRAQFVTPRWFLPTYFRYVDHGVRWTLERLHNSGTTLDRQAPQVSGLHTSKGKA